MAQELEDVLPFSLIGTRGWEGPSHAGRVYDRADLCVTCETDFCVARCSVRERVDDRVIA